MLGNNFQPKSSYINRDNAYPAGCSAPIAGDTCLMINEIFAKGKMLNKKFSGQSWTVTSRTIKGHKWKTPAINRHCELQRIRENAHKNA